MLWHEWYQIERSPGAHLFILMSIIFCSYCLGRVDNYFITLATRPASWWGDQEGNELQCNLFHLNLLSAMEGKPTRTHTHIHSYKMKLWSWAGLITAQKNIQCLPTQLQIIRKLDNWIVVEVMAIGHSLFAKEYYDVMVRFWSSLNVFLHSWRDQNRNA